MKVEELKEKINHKEDIMILDVREGDEVAGNEDPIPGAKNMPMGKVFVEAKKGNLPKDEKIVTICKTGGRCEIVARELGAKGYDIDYLEGGLEAWDEAQASSDA